MKGFFSAFSLCGGNSGAFHSNVWPLLSSVEFNRLFPVTFASDVVIDTRFHHHSDKIKLCRFFFLGLITCAIAKTNIAWVDFGIQSGKQFQERKHVALLDIIDN